MSKHPTEQTPLLRRTLNVPVDVDVERGDRTDTWRTSSLVPVAAAAASGEADRVIEGGGGGGEGGGNGRTTTTTTTTTMAMTPIPWRQLLTLCLVRLVDPICFSQIFPYINNQLLDMGVVGPNEPERVGFYSGLIESAFSVAVAVAIYPWARLSGTSDRRYPQDNHLPLFLLSFLSLISSPFLFLRPGRTKTGAVIWHHRSDGRDGQLWNGE